LSCLGLADPLRIVLWFTAPSHNRLAKANKSRARIESIYPEMELTGGLPCIRIGNGQACKALQGVVRSRQRGHAVKPRKPIQTIPSLPVSDGLP
jgi:hypothetical protein